MQKVILPVPFSTACKRLPAHSKAHGTAFLELHFSIGYSLQRALQTGGGLATHQTVDYITQLLLASKENEAKAKTSWPESTLAQLCKTGGFFLTDFTNLMDGWNIFFVRQRYRDERQRETVIHQLVGHPLALLYQLQTGEKPPKELKPELAQFAQGLGMAELVRRFWFNVHEGRIVIAESELVAHSIDPKILMQREVSPELEALLLQYSQTAVEQMKTSLAALQGTPAEPLLPFLDSLFSYEEACLQESTRAHFDPSRPTIELPFIKRLFLR